MSAQGWVVTAITFFLSGLAVAPIRPVVSIVCFWLLGSVLGFYFILSGSVWLGLTQCAAIAFLSWQLLGFELLNRPLSSAIENKREPLRQVLAALCGLGVAALIVISIPEVTSHEDISRGLYALGFELIQHDYLPLCLLFLGVIVVSIGCGLLARPLKKGLK